MSDPINIVVIGSGLAGYGVLRELRRLSAEARLILVTLDQGHFYSKPALSTALAKAKTTETLVTMPAERMATQLGLTMHTGQQAVAIDRTRQSIQLHGPLNGQTIFYDALIIATGADPIVPQISGDGAGCAFPINGLDHYAMFRSNLTPGSRVLILGAGLVGTEFANDLACSGYAPVVVDMLDYPLAQLVPSQVGTAVQQALEALGVTWHFGRKVTQLDRTASGLRAELDDGSILEADIAISAVGLRPNTQLAKATGLETGRGIMVDSFGRTSDPHIYAIGDCAEYPQGPAAYVTPIMAAARAIAGNVLGAESEIAFPPLSVQVKTTALPVALLPAPVGVAGGWEAQKVDSGLKYLFRDSSGTLRGYVLAGDCCKERPDMDRLFAEQPGGTG